MGLPVARQWRASRGAVRPEAKRARRPTRPLRRSRQAPRERYPLPRRLDSALDPQEQRGAQRAPRLARLRPERAYAGKLRMCFAAGAKERLSLGLLVAGGDASDVLEA